MRLGYVAVALGLGCKPNRKFRLASYSETRLEETVAANLECLRRTLEFNARHGLRFFRIGSDLVPFASHPVCTFDWRGRFRNELRALGAWVRARHMRIAMHPGQYVVLNSTVPGVVDRAVAELTYHATLLDAMELGCDAKIQIHVGGVRGNKREAMERFCLQFSRLDGRLRQRLVIENDDRSFALADCLEISRATGVPVVLDTLHHQCLNQGEPLHEALRSAAATWGPQDGPPMIDFSTQRPGGRPGAHGDTLDEDAFRHFLAAAAGMDIDVMFELRDKEASALRALELCRTHADKPCAEELPTRSGK